MSCACGCGSPAPLAGPRRRKPLGAARGRSRYRGIGDAGDDVDLSADLGTYASAALADYATAKKIYDAASEAVQALNAKNEQQWKEVQAGMEAYVGILSTAAGVPWAGALFDAWFSQQSGATSGPGVCNTDPPKASDWPTLRTWAHYQDWAYPDPSGYDHGPPGSFEAWANPQLEYNIVLDVNCFGDKTQSNASLLAHLLAVWNTTHAGPSRTVKVTRINAACSRDSCPNPIPYTPITRALAEAFADKFPNGDYVNADGYIVQGTGTPVNATASFTVNDGPLIVPPKKVAVLKLPPSHPLATTAVRAASTAVETGASSPGGTAAAVATVGLVGAAGVFFYLRGLPPVLARLLR